MALVPLTGQSRKATPPGLGLARQPLGEGGRDRAHLDERLAGAGAGEDAVRAEDRGLDRRQRRQERADGIGRAGHVRGGRRQRAPQRRQRSGLLRQHVVADHLLAGRQQPRGDRVPQEADSDHADPRASHRAEL
jgi:hypothetical protein